MARCCVLGCEVKIDGFDGIIRARQPTRKHHRDVCACVRVYVVAGVPVWLPIGQIKTNKKSMWACATKMITGDCNACVQVSVCVWLLGTAGEAFCFVVMFSRVPPMLHILHFTATTFRCDKHLREHAATWLRAIALISNVLKAFTLFHFEWFMATRLNYGEKLFINIFSTI